jgi:hypothetical protein
MNEEEYKKFLEYLFNEYIRYRRPRIRRRFHPFEWLHEWDWEWNRLTKAARVLRYIHRFCEDEDDIYHTFTRERIAQLPGEIHDGLRLHNRLAEEGGFLEAFDEHYDEIVDGLKLEYMPDVELDVLRDLGSEDPEAELTAMIHMVRSRRQRVLAMNREIRISQQLKQAEERLDQQRKELAEEEKVEKPKRKSRRWFKGLGQIAQGSALSVANIGLAVGVFTFPVPAATATWGALVSSITGVGVVLNGIGDFRGE